MNLLIEKPEPYIDIANDRDIKKFLSHMPAELHHFVDEVGGLRSLLSKCSLFSFDDREHNILFLNSQWDVYEKYKMVREHDLATNPPECEEPLFNSKVTSCVTFKEGNTNHYIIATDSTSEESKENFIKSLSAYGNISNTTVETSNFSIEELDPKTKKMSKVNVITIDGRKDKSSENASTKALKSLIDEHGKDAIDMRKKCLKCDCIVLDGYLCKCIDSKKYEQRYEKPDDNTLGVYTLSKPPHHKIKNSDPVSEWFEQTRGEGNAPKIEEISDDENFNYDDDGGAGCVVNVGVQADLTMDQRRKNEILMDTNKELISKVKTLTTKNEKLMDDMKKTKHKYSMSTDRFRNEITDQKNQVDVGKCFLLEFSASVWECCVRTVDICRYADMQP